MLAAGAGNGPVFGNGAGHDILGRLLERLALELDRHGCGGRQGRSSSLGVVIVVVVWAVMHGRGRRGLLPLRWSLSVSSGCGRWLGAHLFTPRGQAAVEPAFFMGRGAGRPLFGGGEETRESMGGRVGLRVLPRVRYLARRRCLDAQKTKRRRVQKGKGSNRAIEGSQVEAIQADLPFFTWPPSRVSAKVSPFFLPSFSRLVPEHPERGGMRWTRGRAGDNVWGKGGGGSIAPRCAG